MCFFLFPARFGGDFRRRSAFETDLPDAADFPRTSACFFATVLRGAIAASVASLSERFRAFNSLRASLAVRFAILCAFRATFSTALDTITRLRAAARTLRALVT